MNASAARCPMRPMGRGYLCCAEHNVSVERPTVVSTGPSSAAGLWFRLSVARFELRDSDQQIGGRGAANLEREVTATGPRVVQLQGGDRGGSTRTSGKACVHPGYGCLHHFQVRLDISNSVLWCDVVL